MDLRAALRGLNLGIGLRTCPECGDLMDEDYVRDPLTQDHWRGVRAHVCRECDHAEYVDLHPR